MGDNRKQPKLRARQSIFVMALVSVLSVIGILLGVVYLVPLGDHPRGEEGSRNASNAGPPPPTPLLAPTKFPAIEAIVPPVGGGDESLFAAVDQELERFVKANIAFNSPDSLQLGQSSTIQVLLSTQESVSALQEQIEAEGTKAGAEIEVSPTMRASLTGAGYLIEPITSEIQFVSGYKNTEWLWEIVPKKTGIQTLRLSMSAVISVAGRERERFIETFSRVIEVRVDEILRPLKEAEIDFESPEAVQTSEPSIVKLLVSPQEPVGLANSMEASLTGAKFGIQPLTPEIQPISDTGQTEWRWEVVPNEPGSHSLHLALSAIIDLAENPTPLALRIDEGQYYETLEVRNTWPKLDFVH